MKYSSSGTVAFLHQFGRFPGDSTGPNGPLLALPGGVLYGVAGGGSNGVGSVFTIHTDGSGYHVLYSFLNGTNGVVWPQAPLIYGGDGNLYGCTTFGGRQNIGTVFSISLDGFQYKLLHEFSGSPNDGSLPGRAGLVMGENGDLFGTTSQGGTYQNSTNSILGGTIFKVNRDGSGFSILHSFRGGTNDGDLPQAGLTIGRNGMLYGTTASGGFYHSDGSPTGGTIFRINLDGSAYTVLHSFNNFPDGAVPQDSMIQAGDGLLYGTICNGGCYSGSGLAFRISLDGANYQVLHIFPSFASDGKGPWGPLVQGSDGGIYGITLCGGIDDDGTMFRLSLPQVPPLLISISKSSSGPTNIRFVGQVGALYKIETSTNLHDWSVIATVFNDSEEIDVPDFVTGNTSETFYRAVQMIQ